MINKTDQSEQHGIGAIVTTCSASAFHLCRCTAVEKKNISSSLNYGGQKSACLFLFFLFDSTPTAFDVFLLFS